MIDQGHIEKADSRSNKNSTDSHKSKKGELAIKLAFDSKVINKSMHKNKNQMPNIFSPIQLISEILKVNAQRKASFFKTIDLK